MRRSLIVVLALIAVGVAAVVGALVLHVTVAPESTARATSHPVAAQPANTPAEAGLDLIFGARQRELLALGGVLVAGLAAGVVAHVRRRDRSVVQDSRSGKPAVLEIG